MKKSIFSCALSATLLIAANVSAQPRPAGQGGENRPNSSNAQAARPAQAITPTTKPSADTMNNKMENHMENRMENRQERREDFKNTSPDQKEKIIENRGERSEKFQHASP